MNIKEGFQINIPNVFIPWTISQRELKKLLVKHGLRHIGVGHFAISCVSLGGMNHELGFHFDPPTNNRLSEFEFFQKPDHDQKKSYETFQSHFKNEFGKPTESFSGPEGFDTCIWRIDSIEIVHSVYERFGPEECMRIKRISKKGFSPIIYIHNFLNYCANLYCQADGHYSKSRSITIFYGIVFLIIFLLALPVLLIFGIYALGSLLFESLWPNLLRRIKGKR